jgi:hypothetical protein
MTTLSLFLLGLGFSFVFVLWLLMAAVYLWSLMSGDRN